MINRQYTVFHIAFEDKYILIEKYIVGLENEHDAGVYL